MTHASLFVLFVLSAVGFPQLTPAPPELTALAAEVIDEGALSPIPLMGSDGRQGGVLYDPLSAAAVRVRMARAAGADPGSSRAPQLVVVVVYPRACGGEAPATAIRVFTGNAPRQPLGILRFGSGAQATLPGEKWPDESRLVLFQAFPWNDVRVEAEFSGCADDSTATFEVGTKPAGPVSPLDPWLTVPDGTRGVLSSTSVFLTAWIDRAGKARFVQATDGPDSLFAAATNYIEGHEFRPLELNGVPIVTQVSFRLGFQKPGAERPATASSNSRSTEIATEASPELADTPPRCAVAEDANYGYEAANPIRVGGEPFEGPARQRAFLSNLRGPAGESVRFRRLGSVPVGVNAVGGLLDLYEVIHSDLEASVRIYMDVYSTGDLRAPAGFKCAAPFNIGG